MDHTNVFQHTHIEEHINVSSHRKMTTRKERRSEKGFVKQLQKSIEKTVRSCLLLSIVQEHFYFEGNSHLRIPRTRCRDYTGNGPNSPYVKVDLVHPYQMRISVRAKCKHWTSSPEERGVLRKNSRVISKQSRYYYVGMKNI